ATAGQASRAPESAFHPARSRLRLPGRAPRRYGSRGHPDLDDLLISFREELEPSLSRIPARIHGSKTRRRVKERLESAANEVGHGSETPRGRAKTRQCPKTAECAPSVSQSETRVSTPRGVISLTERDVSPAS